MLSILASKVGGGAGVEVVLGSGVGLGVGIRVVAGRSCLSGQASESAQCLAAGFWAIRQLKHLGGHEHRSMPCLPRQLKPEWLAVL
jgi:hypothetical protein